MKNEKNIKDKLTVVIVSFNSGELIVKVLGELISSSICRVVIVDNASKDNSLLILKENFPEVNLITLPVNMGYGVAANKGLREVNTDYALLINPDILLTTDSLLQVFENVLEAEPNIAVFSPALKKEGFLNKGRVYVDYLIGAFLLFNMDALREADFFDENIFLFYEEKDLELRLIKLGYKLVLLSDIYVEHIGSASSGRNEKIQFLRNWHVAWSNLYYINKHKLKNIKILILVLAIKYGFKSVVNSGWKKNKYKARFKGVLAYMYGKKAFESDGFGRHAKDL